MKPSRRLRSQPLRNASGSGWIPPSPATGSTKQRRRGSLFLRRPSPFRPTGSEKRTAPEVGVGPRCCSVSWIPASCRGRLDALICVEGSLTAQWSGLVAHAEPAISSQACLGSASTVSVPEFREVTT
jgi:hypothetical protein